MRFVLEIVRPSTKDPGSLWIFDNKPSRNVDDCWWFIPPIKMVKFGWIINVYYISLLFDPLKTLQKFGSLGFQSSVSHTAEYFCREFRGVSFIKHDGQFGSVLVVLFGRRFPAKTERTLHLDFLSFLCDKSMKQMPLKP